ncbi:phosphotransferase [Nocardioides maradonensis]
MAGPTVAGVEDRVARATLERHGFAEDAQLRMINLSENATYLVEEGAGDRRAIVRVHREGYHGLDAIRSELEWMAALRRDAGIATSTVVPAPDGELVVKVDVDGTERYAVVFEVAPGIEPDDTVLRATDFETLGAITARMHEHARSWRAPEGFTRFAWDWEHTLGDTPRWGRWRDGIGVTDEARVVLGRAAELVGSRLAEYGQGPDRFGLVHADLRLANLLVHDDTTTVIDFDDCGWSWFMYDFGTAVSFLEHDPRLGEWQEAWLRGYRTVTELGAEDEAMLATFTMLRRLLLVAWMGSHSHSRECQELGPDYTAGSIELAERYLASAGRSLL